MSVRLFIRDNVDGTVHEYGTNPHDALILMEDGSLHYENMQNCSGTMFPEYGYTFCCDAAGTDPRTLPECTIHGMEPYVDISGDFFDGL